MKESYNLFQNGQSFRKVLAKFQKHLPWKLSNSFKCPRETLKSKMYLKCIGPETSIVLLALNNIQFLRISEKSLQNNAPPTMLFSTQPCYFLTYHQRHLLQYTTQATHASMLATPPMLACHPLQHVTHSIHTGTSSMLATIVHKAFENNSSF